jgi:hypothetical protein
MGQPPIGAFVYKRPQHAQRMLKSLLSNPEASTMPIYIYCDGPRNRSDVEQVSLTRAVVRQLAPPHSIIVDRAENMGLANSIISGVSEMCDRHGRAVVLEDDLIFSPTTLRYLSQALDRYEEHEKIMHVSAYMFPVDVRLPETFLYREATCWGWATWARAWKKFEPDGRVIRDYLRNKGIEHEFDVRGSMFFTKMLEQQISGQNNSWAIRWYGSMAMHEGLALHPGKSFVLNIGFDGTGEHCTPSDLFDVKIYDQDITNWTEPTFESAAAVEAMIRYRRSWYHRRPTLATRVRRLWEKVR